MRKGLTGLALAIWALPAAAQDGDTAACDAACGVPCYFGVCSPAKANYEQALERCDVARLEQIAAFFAGTAYAARAGEAARTLRAQGQGLARIRATPNACTALVEGEGQGTGWTTRPDSPPADPCAVVNVPAGWSCVNRDGRADLVGPVTRGEPTLGVDEAFALGAEYASGKTIAQDHARAAAFFRQACNGGHARGCSNLGTKYDQGEGVPQNPSQAIDLFRQACDMGGVAGCNNLAFHYRGGNGVVQDLNRAIDLFRQACNLGNGDGMSCFNLGVMYERGEGVARNPALAEQLFRQVLRSDEVVMRDLASQALQRLGVTP